MPLGAGLHVFVAPCESIPVIPGLGEYTYDDNGNMTFDGVNEYLYDPENRLMQVHVERTTTLSTACDTTIPITTGGVTNWSVTSVGSHYGGSCAVSGDIDDYETSWMEMKVVGPGTVTFWWKVSSEYGDCLEFHIDDVRKATIDGTVAWTQSSAYQITGAGTHTLRWQYVKDGSGSENDDCGWVDYVQWSGFTPPQPPGTWQTLRYNYDHDGRRIEKKYDGQTVLTYVYDGDHCIAEYDGSGVLQRKYVYGPGVDQPICMIEGAATSYYHFDALGSVVALSNAAGNTIQVYEYSVWGQVGASDPNHTNPYIFTARRFDKETGLYYYRARYYHPEIGRFLQTDPIGYSAGMNLYRYCSNNPWNRTDPFGLDPCDPYDQYDPCDCGLYLCDPNGMCIPHFELYRLTDGTLGSSFSSTPANLGVRVDHAAGFAHYTAISGQAGVTKEVIDATPYILIWLCQFFSRNKGKSEMKPAPAPPKPPKPPDNCSEETHGYYDKDLKKEIPAGNIHHHIQTHNWDGKEWRPGSWSSKHFPGPCPPDTHKIEGKRTPGRKR